MNRVRHSASIALAVLAAFTIAAVCTRDSLASGRLAWHPRVDDVLYLARAAELVQPVREHGAAGVSSVIESMWTNWHARPPHAPGLTALLGTGFALAGSELWLVYLTLAAPAAVLACSAALRAR